MKKVFGTLLMEIGIKHLYLQNHYTYLQNQLFIVLCFSSVQLHDIIHIYLIVYLQNNRCG